MAEDFVKAVDDGLKLAKRVYAGKDRAMAAPPKLTPPMDKSAVEMEVIQGLPSAPMVYAVIYDPAIVDNPDIPTYQPHVYGRRDPPALIPLQMNGVELEVDCYLDTAFVRVRGSWRVHCVMESRSCDCLVAIPMGEQVFRNTMFGAEGRPQHCCAWRGVASSFPEFASPIVPEEEMRELQAFVRIFGGYGVDRLDRLLKEHTAALLNCIDTSLCSNREVLEAIAGSLHSGDRIEREASMKQIVDMDTLIEFCVQAGLALAFDGFLAEAAGAVLEEGAPLMYSLLAEVVKHVPDEIPEKKEIRRLKGVTNSIGVVCDHDSQWVRSVLEEVGGANDGSWSLLPYLFATFMASNVCNTTAFNVKTGGFNNNIHCLARCISAVIAGSEFVRLEREHWQRQSFSNGHVGETLDSEIQSRLSAEASISILFLTRHFIVSNDM